MSDISVFQGHGVQIHVYTYIDMYVYFTLLHCLLLSYTSVCTQKFNQFFRHGYVFFTF